ncbi:MAG: NAD(P)-dependent oxidoreductase, partial [Desulfobacteraceae bacterium]|nr:NAD(P)-dependent oxidoreductase [Desulfobacteraceae bacterium]
FHKLYSNINKVVSKSIIDIIIHFASILPKSFRSSTFENHYFPNVIMMNHLFNFSIKNKVKKFIYISSFGSMKQSTDFVINDFYTMSKITGEYFCSVMENHGIQTASLRLSSPYGEFSTTNNVLNLFIKKALKNKDITVYGSGSREQNFIYAKDIVQAIELCVEKKISGVYSIVSENNIAMLNLANIIIEITKSKSKVLVNVQPDPQEGYKPIYDYKRAHKELNFKPKFNINQGLFNYINWLQLK